MYHALPSLSCLLRACGGPILLLISTAIAYCLCRCLLLLPLTGPLTLLRALLVVAVRDDEHPEAQGPRGRGHAGADERAPAGGHDAYH